MSSLPGGFTTTDQIAHSLVQEITTDLTIKVQEILLCVTFSKVSQYLPMSVFEDLKEDHLSLKLSGLAYSMTDGSGIFDITLDDTMATFWSSSLSSMLEKYLHA